MFATTSSTLSIIFAGAFLLSAGARVGFRSLPTLPIGCRA
jgi:hypothetical protein